MVAWNPQNPDTIGLQWPAYQEGVVLLDSTVATAPAKVVSSASETIDQLQLAHKYSASPASGYGRRWTDVYDLSSATIAPGTSGVVELKYSPNGDKTRLGVTQEDFATTAPLYPRLASTDDSGPPETAVGYTVNSQFWTNGQYLGVNFNTAAIANTYRIVYVRFEVRLKGFDWSWQQPNVNLDVYNGATLVGRIGTVSPPQDYVFRTYTFGPFYYDFYNEGPWLQPEIVAYSNAAQRNIRIGYDYACAVSRLTMIVGVIPENRVAVGIDTKVTVPPAGTVTNNPILFKTPLNVDNWAKVTGTNYIAVTRRLEDPFGSLATLIPQIITLDSGAACPVDDGTVYTGATMADASGVLTSIGSPSTKMAGFVLGTSGGAESVDGQPYIDIEAKNVDWNQPVSQALSAATNTAQYARLRVLAASKTTRPTVPLLFGLRKTSTADITDAFTGAISASFTAGSFTAGAAASAATNQLVYTTGTTANAYARHRTTSAQNANFLMTGKVTFASIASAHYATIFCRASTTFTSTGTNPGLTSGYIIRLTANGGVSVYTVGAATAGTEVLVKTASFTFTTAQHSFKVVALTNGFIGIKVWATAGTEPTTWTLSLVDTTYTGTFLGLGAQNDAAGGSSRTVSFDDFALYNMLSTGDLTAADLTDTTIATSKGSYTFTPTVDVYDCTITMDTAVTLAAATDYTVECAALQDPTSPWYLLWLDGTASHALTGNIGYVGSTDAAAFGGAATTAQADFFMTLGTIPTPPTTVTVALQSTAFANNGGSKCAAGSLTYPRVTWTTSVTLGSSFTRYEIQRSYDSGATWTDAASGTTEATKTWDNKEVRRGVAVQYRVRVVRSDGAVSAWTTQTGTVTVPKSSGVLAIVSDADASVIGGYVILGAQQQYDFGDQTSYMTVHGRDYQLGFKSPQIGSLTWQFPVLIYTIDEDNPSNTPSGGAGMQAFAAIRALARAAVPYLALLTPDGEVLCGALEVPSGVRTEPAHEYIAMVKFTQTQAAPTAVTF